ncbi:MAG TPA: tetratricopeptide repeat protein, partial [Desulfobacterales bacterium]|nr:tetratricopeptide repeat protein [Desulfobacterales bacterium]
LQPGNLEILNAIASLYIELRKPLEAQELLNEILKKDKGHVGGRVTKARLLLTEKRNKEATEILHDIVKDQPRHARAHYYLGLAYLSENDRARAKGEFLAASEYNLPNSNAQMLLAKIYLAEGAPDLALEQLNLVLSKAPGNDRAYLLSGNAYFLKEDTKRARKAYARAAQIRPEDPAAYYQLGKLELRERRYDDAMAYLDKVLALKADHVPALTAKVSVYTAQAEPAKALSFLDEKISEHGKNLRLTAVLHATRGNVLFSQKDYEQSEADFEKALDLNPDLIAPHFFLARIHLSKNETAKAISQYEEILEKEPRVIQAYTALGTLYDGEGKKAEARNMYEKALEIDPGFAPAANNLAWMLVKEGEATDLALNLAKKAKARLPDDPVIADTLGLALTTKGLYASAVSELIDAAQKMPQNPTILYHLGLAHWKNGDKE